MWKTTTTSFKDFGLSRPYIEPTTSRSPGARSNHLATAAVEIYLDMNHGFSILRTVLKASVF